MAADEVMFTVSESFVMPGLLDAATGIAAVREAGTRALRTTYVDTSDLRLVRNGLRLRHRTGEGPPAWTLTVPSSGASSARPDEQRNLAVAGPADAVPDELRGLVTAWVRSGTLVTVADVRTSRTTLQLLDAPGESLAEVVDDRVSVVEGSRPGVSFRHVTVCRREGHADVMDAVVQRIEEAGAHRRDAHDAVVGALGPGAQAPSDLPAPGDVGPGSDAADVVRYALCTGVLRVVGHDVGVRRNEDDAVHQMRVGCRRLRSDLRTFTPLIDKAWARRLRDELSWLADLLGEPRDLEVLRARLAKAAVADPLAPMDPDAVARIDAVLAERENEALSDVQSALRSDRYVNLLDDLVEAARNPRFRSRASDPARRVLPELVAASWKKCRRKGSRLKPDASDHAWHKVRIKAKRVRYAAEAVESAVGKDAKRMAKRAAKVQDVLGDHQDAVVAAQTFLELARAHPDDTELVVTAGRLVEYERSVVRERRSSFPAAWRRLSRDRTTRWLDT